MSPLLGSMPTGVALIRTVSRILPQLVGRHRCRPQLPGQGQGLSLVDVGDGHLPALFQNGKGNGPGGAAGPEDEKRAAR